VTPPPSEAHETIVARLTARLVPGTQATLDVDVALLFGGL
jgi:hypothetical protein